MLNQNFLKRTAVIFLLLIAIVFLGLYGYSISQQEELSTPEKVYRVPTEAEMEIVRQNRQNIRNAKQRQQPGSNQQNLASENPERSDAVDPKSNEDLAKSQVNIKEDLDNPIIEQLIKNGSLKVNEHVDVDWGERPTVFNDLVPIRGNPTFQTNSFEELQNYISKLENSDNPKHRKAAQNFRNSLSRMNPSENSENVIFTISVED